MKKILSTAILLFGLMVSTHAHATAVFDFIGYTVQLAWKAADEGWKKAKDAYDQSVWAQQLGSMTQSVQKLQTTIDKIQDASKKATSLVTGVRNAGSISTLLSNKGSPGLNVDYKYAPLLPRYYTPTFNCDVNGCATATNDGYAGNATQMTSKQIREEMKVNSSITGINIKTVSNEAAERNAQEIAVIQAMAQEAYTQANNRIATIGKLQYAIDHPLDVNNNDAKYIADLQARIQTEQALLVNEQNKLAALAILQQSQRDAYEQRKREIAAYMVNGGAVGGGGPAGGIGSLVSSAQRGLINAGQSAAYAAVVAAYQ